VDDLADIFKRLTRLERAVSSVIPHHVWAAIDEQDRYALPPVPRVPEPPAPLRIQGVASALGIPDKYSEARAVIEAWSISKGLPVVGTQVPGDAVPELRTIHQARAGGRSWRAAIVAAGLPVPDEAVIADQALAVRLETAALVQYLADLAQTMLEHEGHNPYSRASLASGLDKIFGGAA
jgi:hypothetical protein